MLHVPSVDLNVKLDGFRNTGFSAMPDMSVQTSAPMSRSISYAGTDFEPKESVDSMAVVGHVSRSSSSTSLRDIRIRKVGHHKGRTRPFTLHIDAINISMPMAAPQQATPVPKPKMRSVAVQAGEPQVPYTKAGPWGKRWLCVCRFFRPVKRCFGLAGKLVLMLLARVAIGVNLSPFFSAQVR